MTQRKRDPIIKCRFCGKQLKRKRHEGKLETRAAFRKRVYCDRVCFARDILRKAEEKQ